MVLNIYMAIGCFCSKLMEKIVSFRREIAKKDCIIYGNQKPSTNYRRVMKTDAEYSSRYDGINHIVSERIGK